MNKKVKRISPEIIAENRIQQALESKSILLDLSELGIEKIPRSIRECEFLEELKLRSNNIRKIENLESLIQLKSLDLGNNYIVQISGLETLVALETLKLSINKITSISGLDKLPNLKSLKIDYNKISKIDGLDILISLEYLNLRSNKIQNISGLGELVQLKTLDLSYNQISKIEEINYLDNLHDLILIGNKIKEADVSSSSLNLRLLAFNENSISSSIFRFITAQKNLTGLFLENCQIGRDDIKENESFITYLENKMGLLLKIGSNPFIENTDGVNPRDYEGKVLKSHLKVFLKDYEKIISEKVDLTLTHLPHKLVLLGNSNSGKTSLAKYLVEDKLLDGKNPESTQILEIVAWKEKEQTEFFIYDFGGQDFYHGTYQMYFSKNASYALVWSKDNNYNYLHSKATDERKEAYHCFDVNYWLGNIRYLNQTIRTERNSDEKNQKDEKWYRNLILIENKIDASFNPSYPLNSHLSFGEIENFKSCFIKNENKEFQIRRSWLKNYLQNLEATSYLDPIGLATATKAYVDNWTELREEKNVWEINELTSHLSIRLPEWKALDEIDQHRLLRRFHISGMLIWYEDQEELSNKIWIDPVRLQETVLNFLNKEKLKKYHGIILETRLKKDPEFESIRALLIHQNIIFRDNYYKQEKKPVYIIPQNLNSDIEKNPLFQIAVQGLNQSFAIRFKHFMPMGIMNRLICMFGTTKEAKFYSRYKMVFTYGGQKVLLICNMIALTIEILANDLADNTKKKIFEKILLAYHRKNRFSIFLADNKNNNDLPQVKSAEDYSKLEMEKPPSINELVPEDLQIALEEDIYVNYQDLIKAVVKDDHLIKGTDINGKESFLSTFSYNPFLEESFTRPLSVFISYSHDDIAERQTLQKHLVTLEQDGLIEIWQDGKIQPGTNWDRTIKENLNRADIVILLVSQSFIASNYSNTVELSLSLGQGKQIIPILIKSCDFVNWKGIPSEIREDLKGEKVEMANFQFLPQNEALRLEPIVKWTNPNDAWVQISQKLRELVKEKFNN